MPILDLSGWGYPTGQFLEKKYKCRVHGVVVNMVKVEARNVHYDLVFDRRYCTICLDTFLRQHLEPMVEVKPEEKVDRYE